MFIKLNHIPNSAFPDGEVCWLQSLVIETIHEYPWGTVDGLVNIRNLGSIVTTTGVSGPMYIKQSPEQIVNATLKNKGISV